MPQPKQTPPTPSPPVRGDATADPAPAVAPGASIEQAVERAVSAPRAPKPAPAKRAAAGKAKGAAAVKAKGAASAKGAAAAKAKPTASAKGAAAAKAKPAAAAPATSAATGPPGKPDRTGEARPTAKPGRAATRPKAAPAGKAATPKAAARPKAGAAPKAARTSKAPRRPAAAPKPAPEPTSAAARDEAMRANLASLRDLLAGGVVLTAQRLQEAVDETVTRGRMTRRDAEDLATGLLTAGRQQTADLLAELEALLGRGRSDLSTARSITRGAVRGSSDRVLREVDKARRAAGLGRAFPVLGYDELTPAQIRPRLADLTPAELRTVRDYERAHADRVDVRQSVEDALR